MVTALLCILFWWLSHHRIQQTSFTDVFTLCLIPSYTGLHHHSSWYLWSSLIAVDTSLSTHIRADTVCQHPSIHPSFPLLPYRHTMSQPITSTSSITDMSNPVTPQPSWIPLIKSSLFHQAMKKVGYVSVDTSCSIIYGPVVSI